MFLATVRPKLVPWWITPIFWSLATGFFLAAILWATLTPDNPGSSLQQLPTDTSTSLGAFIFKAGHFFGFGLFAGALILTLEGSFRYPSRWWYSVGFTAALSLAGLTEWLQRDIIGRSSHASDVLIDMAGVMIILVVMGISSSVWPGKVLSFLWLKVDKGSESYN